jgi:hypothetical protein
MSRAELIPGDAIAGARKKIDNFLPSRRDGGIVFQKGQETRIALFIDVRALESESKPKGHDSEMVPQAVEIAKNGLGDRDPQPCCPPANSAAATAVISPSAIHRRLKFTASAKPPEATPAVAIWRRSSSDVSASSSSR